VFADEKTTLVEFLDYLRDSVAAKISGVPEEQARNPMVPSGTSLLGLAKHLRVVELGWVKRGQRVGITAGLPSGRPGTTSLFQIQEV